MPELPEVQTTVNGINKLLKGKEICDIWTDLAVKVPTRKDYYTTTKSLDFFKLFKDTVCGTKIKNAERRAKNIFIHLSNGYSVWIHMKMTGHLMYGMYDFDKKTNTWTPHKKEKNLALRDPYNRFLHVVFILKNGKHLVLSDVRKFAKVTMIETSRIDEVMKDFGPEPLDENFTEKGFKERILKYPNKPIKTILLDQKIISGIGNIYSDEALWLSSIHPSRTSISLTNSEIKKLFNSIRISLQKGIEFGGDSTSDYRDIEGKPGSFNNTHEAYRRGGEKCRKKGCGGTITRMEISGRGLYFCDKHQK